MDEVSSKGAGLRKVEIAGRWFGQRPDRTWVVWNGDLGEWERAPAPPDALLPPGFESMPSVTRTAARAVPAGDGRRLWLPPHLRVYFTILCLSAPVIAWLATRDSLYSEWWPGGLVVSLAAEIVVVGAFFAYAEQQRRPARPETRPPSPRDLPPVLASPTGAGTNPWRGRLFTFLLIFVFIFSATFSLGVTATSLLIDLGVAALLTIMWELRGTVGGLVLVAVTAGWLLAAALQVFLVFLSLITWSLDDSAINFPLWWAGSSLVIFLFLLPMKRKLAEFQLSRAQRIIWGTIAAAMIVVMILVGAITRFETSEGSTTPTERIPPVTRSTLGPTFPPPATPEQAADAFVRAWGRGDWAEVARVSSGTVAGRARGLGARRGDYLGCDDLNGTVECVVQTDDSIYLISPSGTGNTYYVAALRSMTPAEYKVLAEQGFDPS